MKKLMVFLLTATAVGLCGATDVWKDVGVDLGTYQMPDSPNFYFMNGPYSVTLSADATISSLHSYSPCNKICYDFRSGNTLTLGTCSTRGGNIDVSFLGGTWSLAGSFFAASDLTNGGDIREVWDGVTVNCNFFGVSHYSYDTFVTFTNGTEVAVSGDIGLFCADSSKEVTAATNCWFVIAGGSKLIGARTCNGVFVDYKWGATHDVDSLWHVEVSGEGSEMSSSGGYPALCIGYKNRGSTVRYSNRATGTFANYVEVGSLAAASDNTLVVDSGASFKVTDYITIGKSAGADRNRLEVLDGATVDVGQYSFVNVGDGSCYNSLVISNATLKAKGVVLGKGADSAYNEFRIYGNSTFSPYGSLSPFFKGEGHHNRYVVDGGYSLGSYGATDFKFVADTDSSVGNVFEIVGGAVVNCDEFYLGTAYNVSAENDHDNRLFVGPGSTLNMSDRILLRGSNDSFVVSNGTVNAYNVYAASCAGSTGTSVRLVGPETVYSPRKGSFTFFGQGQHGEFVMDGTHLGSENTAAHFSDSWSGWSTNNVLKIVNCANFRASTLYIGYPYGGGRGDKGNTLFVGAGSTLDVALVNVTGVDNKVVVSNATVCCSAVSPLVLGDESTGIDIDISGNELVLQGEDVCFKGTNETRNVVMVRHSAKIRFELSGDGYHQVPLQADVDLGADTQVSISISDEMRANLVPRRRNYQLTGELKLAGGMTEESLLSGINADMPKGCHAYVRDKCLWVHVVNSSEIGMSVIVR